jgi:Fe-S-cluster containining protein
MINCKYCPEQQACCGIMIFHKKLIMENKDKVELGWLEIEQKGEFACFIYPDYRCPFLDRKSRLCKIYDRRPQVCRDYGNIEKLQCPYFKRSGNRRSKGSQIKIERHIDKQLKILENGKAVQIC